jgi:hypothetical protein
MVHARRGLLGILALLVALVTGLSVPASGAPPSDRGPAPGADKARATVYIVQMAQDPIVAYEGGIAGFAATAPRPGEHVNPNSAAVGRYRAFLNRTHADALAAAGVRGNAKFYDYTFSFNGFAAELTPGQAARLMSQPGVVAVTVDEQRQLLTDNTPVDLGLSGDGGVWAQYEQTGEDVIIGVIDTGIWPEHPSFSDQSDFAHRPGPAGNALRVYDEPPDHWNGICQSGELWSQQHCNNKLIGARYFVTGAIHQIALPGDYISPRDHDGHGTHTASTAGGNAGVDPSIFGRDLGVDTISGMAPRARIAAYKACLEDGCFTTDLVAAIDTAVADGVDVINYSIGSDTPTLLSADSVAFLFAARAGVFVATSAGNAGPGVSTVGSPAASPWITSVGASTHSRRFDNTVTLGNGASYIGGSVTHGIDAPTRLVDGGEECPDGLDPAEVTGAIVLCLRVTGIPRVEHGAGVLAAGGVGMILYDPPQVNVTPTDNHVLPTSTVFGPDGFAIADYIDDAGDAGEAATASFTAGSAAPDAGAPDMAVFSSRGPNGAVSDIIKPDVTAPGVQILAGNSPTPFIGAAGELFQAIQGTSMSSPHVAGVGALLAGEHDGWSPAMVRSALVTTAHQDVDKEDGTTPADPFDFGGGHIDPLPAMDPGLVYDATYQNYLAFLCGIGELDPAAAPCTAPTVGVIDPSDLNQPTIGVGDLAGVQTVTRTVTNVGPAGTYNVSVEEPDGVDVVVTPSSLTLAAGEKKSYTVTFTTTDEATFDEWVFGSLTWDDGSHSVRSSLAVRPVAISAPESLNLTGVTGTASYEVTFGYDGNFETPVHGLFAPDVDSRTVADDPDNEITVALETGVGIDVVPITVPAGTLHLRASLFDENVDGADDDLDLYLFAPGEYPDGDFADLSGTATSDEQVDVAAPVAGDWTLVVHGWETDGADANYDLFTWLVGTDAIGNLTATPSTSEATVGGTAEIDLAWSGLAAGTRYLGVVGYSDGVTEFGGTLVSVIA